MIPHVYSRTCTINEKEKILVSTQRFKESVRQDIASLLQQVKCVYNYAYIYMWPHIYINMHTVVLYAYLVDFFPLISFCGLQ